MKPTKVTSNTVTTETFHIEEKPGITVLSSHRLNETKLSLTGLVNLRLQIIQKPGYTVRNYWLEFPEEDVRSLLCVESVNIGQIPYELDEVVVKDEKRVYGTEPLRNVLDKFSLGELLLNA